MNPTVVVVEHSPPIARQIASAFERAGYHVSDVVHDGLTALEVIKASEPTVATIDILLPRLGGLHLAGALRRANCPTAIFAVTSVSARERVEAARLLGVQYYALKPVDLDRLAQAAAQFVTDAKETPRAASR